MQCFDHERKLRDAHITTRKQKTAKKNIINNDFLMNFCLVSFHCCCCLLLSLLCANDNRQQVSKIDLIEMQDSGENEWYTRTDWCQLIYSYVYNYLAFLPGRLSLVSSNFFSFIISFLIVLLYFFFLNFFFVGRRVGGGTRRQIRQS